MPSTSVSCVINAPREEIWAVLSDIAVAGRWNSAWSRIEFTSNQTHGSETRFRAHTDDGQTFEFQVTAWVAPEFIEFSPVRDEGERYGITLESQAFRLESVDETATRVDLSARASTHGIRGFILGLFFWRGYQKQGLNTALEGLSSIFEPEGAEAVEEEEAAQASD